MGRSELLAEGETTEKHQEYAREEAEAVALDRANHDPRTGGLFKGVFRRHADRLIAIRDHEDNVWRCPECHHEVEDQWCHACNDRVYYHSDEDEDDFSYASTDSMNEELDHDLELEDDAGLARVEHGFTFADDEAEEVDDVHAYLRDRDLMHATGRASERESIWSDDVSDSGEEHDEEDEEEQDPEMDSFIVNDDDEVEYEGQPTSEDMHTPSFITVADDADEEDDDDSPVITQQRRARPTRTILSDSDDDDDDDGEDDDVRETLPPMRVAFRRNAERHFQTVDSDGDDDEDVADDGDGGSDDQTENGGGSLERDLDSLEPDLADVDDDGSDDDDDDDGDSSQTGVPSSSAAGEGFSPLQHSMQTGYDYYDENDDDDDDDDDDDHNQGWSEGVARWGAHRPAP
jgi:rubrerythrin